MKRIGYFFAALVFSLVCTAVSMAGTVAVFPLLDLTLDSNGVNFSLTESLRKRVVEDGFDVLPENEVISFMVRHRIRNLGALNDYQLTLLNRELGAQYALVGTVCQLGEMPTAKISVTLQLIRTADKEVVWSTTRDLHEADLISFLGIADPDSTDEVYEEYFSTLLETLPGDVAGEEAAVPPNVEILSVTLHPQYVKPGERMEFNARIYSTADRENAPSFTLDIDGKSHEIDVDEETNFLRSSWLAQERDGKYPVSLVAEYPTGRIQVLKVAEYEVDSIPPDLSLNLLGTEIDGTVYFTKELTIMTALQVPEQTSIWDITVYDKYNDPIVHHAGGGQIPQKIYWNGTDDRLESVPDGEYRIVAQAWDQAKNIGRDEKITVRRFTKPLLNFFTNREEDVLNVELENEAGYDLMYWFYKVYKKSGELVAMETGETLPPAISIDMAGISENTGLELIFAAQDVYGNKSYQIVDDLLKLGKKKEIEEFVPESQWLENF